MRRLADIRRAGAGFTMAEALAAIAVLVVLMAVAVPNAVAYQRSLTATELNGKAEQIYNAAQFQLSSLKTAGRLDALASIDGNVVAPPDYSGTSGIESVRYAVKGSDAMRNLIMPESATVASSGAMPGSYAVELSPATGEVYAVYYWEGGATDAAGAKFSGTTEEAVESFYLSVNSYRPATSGSFLADHGIGYFNGGEVTKVEPSSSSSTNTSSSSSSSSSGSEVTSPEPLNGDELEVPISGAFDDLVDGDIDMSKLKLSIHVQQVNQYNGQSDWLDPAHQVVIRMNGGASHAPAMANSGQYIDVAPSDLGADSGGLSYVIDSLETNAAGQVMDVTRQTNGYIERGRGVRITVYAEYEGRTAVYGPYNTSNSLFDSYDAGTKTVGVSSVRHLINLADADALDNQVDTISITSDIVWDPADGAIDPIDVTDIIGTSNQRVIEGNGHVIEGLVIGDESDPVDNAGLFSCLRVNVQNLTLKDCTVYGKNNVGMLVGDQINSGISIRNCKVVGGLVKGESNVGGLVGTGYYAAPYANCSSSASVVATGSGCAGGFIGTAEGCQFENCTAGMSYASGATTTVSGQGCSNIGGFIGLLKGSCNLTGCQAYADVSGLDYIGGFLGCVNDGAWGRLVNCQACVSYDLATGQPVFHRAQGHSYIGGFAGDVVTMNAVTGCRAQVNVSGTGDYIGGFTGYLAASGGGGMSDCMVTGVTVDGSTRRPTYSGSGSNVGAYAGKNDYAWLNNCSSVAERV